MFGFQLDAFFSAALKPAADENWLRWYNLSHLVNFTIVVFFSTKGLIRTRLIMEDVRTPKWGMASPTAFPNIKAIVSWALPGGYRRRDSENAGRPAGVHRTDHHQHCRRELWSICHFLCRAGGLPRQSRPFRR